MSRSIKMARPGVPGTGHYMGDPGIFGSIFGGLKKVVGAGLGLAGASGIPGLSQGAKIAQGIFGNKRTAARAPMATAVNLPPIPMLSAIPLRLAAQGKGAFAHQGPQVPTPGIRGAIQRALPGGATGMQAAGPPPRGYHLNKTSYFLSDGTFVPEGSRYVKNRRRNPLNPRALSRSMARLESAKKAASAMSRITIRKKCPA